MQLLELTIADTSPLIVYLPFRDTYSTPNLTNGWNSYYNSSGFASSTGQVGIGGSSHITSMDGATLSVKWIGNGIRLLGNTTSSSYSVKLDGVDFQPNATSLQNRTLLDIFDLQFGVHNLTLTTRISQTQTPRNSSLVFDGAIIRTIANGASSNSSTSFGPHILDGNRILFNGRWSFDSSGQIHTSTTTGDRACVTFNGTAFILQGMTTPEEGNYSVTLDGVPTQLSARSSFIVPNTTLFFATGLNDSVSHYVEVTNNGGKLSLLENGFWTLSGPDHPPPDVGAKSFDDISYSGGTVAAFALAGVLFAILITLSLFLIWRKRKRRRDDPQSRTWDDKNFVVHNSMPGYGGPLRNSWNFRRRTRASSDFASYGAKGDTMTLESLEGAKSLQSGGKGCSIWQREAVEGNVEGISMPILSKHSAEDDFATLRGKAVSLVSKHPYSVYHPISNRERSAEMKQGSSSTQHDIDLTTVALTNLKNKGKARQITGATTGDSPFESGSHLSFSSHDLLHGLHLKMSSGKKLSKIKTSRGSVSLSLHPSTPLVHGQGSYLSSFRAASNLSARGGESQQSMMSPTETLPSVPRTVSDSGSNTILPNPRQGSRRYLPGDHTELGERDPDSSGEPLTPQPPHGYRNQGNMRDSSLQSTLPNSLSRQVVRNLSPRISEMGIEGNRYSNLNVDHFYPKTPTEEQSILEGDQLLIIKAPSSRDSLSTVHFATNVSPSLGPLPSPMGPVLETRTTDNQEDIAADLPTKADLDGTKLSPILPSLKRTSPLNIRFDWLSERSRRVSESSRLRVPNLDSREDSSITQGPSRNPFRLTPLTMNHSPSTHSYSPSQASTADVITSFLDFTNSSEGSSVRTNSFSIQSTTGSRIFGDPSTRLPQGGRMAELKSRWSDTTFSTRRRDSSREGNNNNNNIPSSSITDKSSRRKTYHTTTPSIYVTSEIPSTKVPVQRESDSTQFSTENPSHVHPTISSDSVESHRHSLSSQKAPEATLSRTTTDESSSSPSSAAGGAAGGSRRTTESSNQFHTRLLLASRYPPLPEGADEASTSSVYQLSPPAGGFVS